MQCKRPGFDPWVGKIPWRRERLPTPVFWPGEFHGLYSPWVQKELDMAEQLSLSAFHKISTNYQKQCWEKKQQRKQAKQIEMYSLLHISDYRVSVDIVN